LKDPQIFRSYLHLVMSQKGDWTREKDKKWKHYVHMQDDYGT
jgi:hypothetical protein